MTNTLGGINSSLSFSVLQEQLTPYTPITSIAPNYNNPNTYDNTQSYYTGLNPNMVDGAVSNRNGSFGINGTDNGNYKRMGHAGSPIIQKDFAGVANIFAPNIYISNPPLNSNGYPDISYSA